MGCSCAAEIMEVSDLIEEKWEEWYENIALFEMEIGQGLTALAGAWETCCELPYNVTVDVPVWVPGDPNANPPIPGMYMTKGVPIAGAGAVAQSGWAAGQHDAQINANNAWATQTQNWIDSYNEWQDTQQLIAAGQLALYFVTLKEFIDSYKDFQDCANEEQANLKDVRAQISTVAASARGAYDTHVTEAIGGNPVSWADLGNMAEEVCALPQKLYDYQSEACFGYEKIQKDHIQNMGTHLAELCVNARDVSNSLSTGLQDLDGAWLSGGTFANYENCLLEGGGSLADFLCQAHTQGEELSNALQECGELISKCYVDGAGGEFNEIIKPALNGIIDQWVAGGPILADLRENTNTAQECLAQVKANFTAVYEAQEAGGGGTDKVMSIANDLFCSDVGATFFSDCLSTMQECIVDNKEILDRYLGTNAGDMSSGEFCLGRVIIDQACGMVNDLQNAVTFLSTHKDNCIDDYESSYQIKEGTMALTLLNLACDLAQCMTAAHTWFTVHSDDLENCWADGYSGEKDFALAVLAQSLELANKHSDTFACLNGCANEAKTCYTMNYLADEKLTGELIHDNAQALASCLPTTHEWMVEHASQLEVCWTAGYTGEKVYASQALSEAELLNQNHSEVYICLKDCLDEAKSCYSDFWLAQEKSTALEIHENTQELANCLPLAHNWLCDQADKHRDRYCEFWVPKEDAYVCAILDKAIELACQSQECLAKWCEDLEDKWDWWMSCFQDAEKDTIPKLINAAIDACDKNLATYNEACSRADELYDKYMDNWCPCDIEDLNKHCQIWNKVNMLEEICDANTCIRTTAEVLKECYEDMLNCEKDYLEFVCNMSNDPKYCDMESRAIAHTRKLYDQTVEEIEQCTPPWCQAAAFDRILDTRDQQARAESLSIQIADRWEWLRNVHEEDRKHNYLQDIIRNYGERWISNSHEMYRSVQQGNDMLLRHVHDRIVRGQLYLQSSFGHLDRTLTALDRTIGNSIQSVNQSHFWPNWYNDGKSAYTNNSINYLRTGTDMMRIGQDLNRQASSDKVQAAQIAMAAVDDGIQIIDRGHATKNRAIDAATRAEQLLANNDQNANQLIQQGHNLHQMAKGAEFDAYRIASDAIQSGLGVIDRGHQVKRHALDAASRADSVVQASQGQGIQMVDRGHQLHQMAASAQQNAGDLAYRATQQGLQTVDRGHAVKRMAMDGAAQQGQLAHSGIQDGLNSIQQGHFWADLAQRTGTQKMQSFNDVWRNFYSHLSHGKSYLDNAARWGDVANTAMRNEIATGEMAMQNSLGWFNSATRKMESALNSQDQHIREAIQLLSVGHGRMNTVLDSQIATQGQIRASTDGISNMATVGNRFLFASADATTSGLNQKKAIMDCICDMVRARFTDTQGMEIGLGSSILGSSYAASQNALGQITGLSNGIVSALQQLAGPPPTFPLGAGTGLNGAGSGGGTGGGGGGNFFGQGYGSGFNTGYIP